MIDPFRNYQCLFVVIMPFWPILLDLQDFCQSPPNKGLWRSSVQIPRPITTVGSLAKERLLSSIFDGVPGRFGQR